MYLNLRGFLIKTTPIQIKKNTLNQIISPVVLVNRKYLRSLRVMCVLYISRMTSSHITTRNGWSHQTEGPTDMSHLTNEGTDVARLAKVAPDVARLDYKDTDVAHLSTDDAHLVMAKADMTNVDTLARPRTTATAVTGNDVSDMRSAGRKGMCPLTLD